MPGAISTFVIAGGGTAGWLSACRLAAWARDDELPVRVILVEDPATPTIGVGEGTWPTMRETLRRIGIDEAEFLVECDASFKQGSLFRGWRRGGDHYLHPFTEPPEAPDARHLLAAWQASGGGDFTPAMTSQDAVVEASLAPRTRAMPPYAGALNYGYHLDAGKFARLLQRHATQRLGVVHRRERIAGVEGTPERIEALVTAGGERIAGDLFVDCTGFAGLLIDRHCGSAWIDRSNLMLNDRALAVQVETAADAPIASATIATAHDAGWFWDIGLPTRRGVGCVYSSAFLDDDGALAVLRRYVAEEVGGAMLSEPRLIRFPTGHRNDFWVGNCIAIGLSAGFIEPLEASAIVLIEASLDMLIEGMPASSAALPAVARRFNETFRARWDSIVEFLKLHYALSERDAPYWQAQRAAQNMPERLAMLLDLWRDQPPSLLDFHRAQEMFPAASYQYVYYGMGGETAGQLPRPDPRLVAQLAALRQKERSLLTSLPGNRAYLDALSSAHQRRSA
ncbi:tryptophan halogenase family protein [Sphingomonas astaxanthinifaciens]|uniref:Tryptophan halogenase n=1 Tax=Sphingomonas astaxanthinifaciens DSM 22298 TaxID=1123267 RepID=A0ABQ5Z8M9_9SPHN|nr:tryptophan halogenase family protein [Sphingomonas astaxanthinifaciens]GLR48345.1 tryptophan halogenase [Sphingomonas astaxanthinifaciens DSM 22298]